MTKQGEIHQQQQKNKTYDFGFVFETRMNDFQHLKSGYFFPFHRFVGKGKGIIVLKNSIEADYRILA
jgi:hypothetical protein